MRTFQVPCAGLSRSVVSGKAASLRVVLFGLSLLFFGAPGLLPAQTTTPAKWAKTAFYSLEEGLSDRHARQMVQDKQGYYWIATSNGLNRFDGYSFLQFDNRAKNPHKISQNEVFFLSLARSGKLLVFNDRFTFDLLDPTTEQLQQKRITDIPQAEFIASMRSKEGVIYTLCGAGNQLFMLEFDEKAEKFNPLFTHIVDTATVHVGFLNRPQRGFLPVSDGTFWIYYRSGQQAKEIIHLGAHGELLEKIVVGQGEKIMATSIVEHGNGVLYLSMDQRGLLTGPIGQTSTRFAPHPTLTNNFYLLNSDDSGNVIAYGVFGAPTCYLFTHDEQFLDYSWIFESSYGDKLQPGYFAVFGADFRRLFFIYSIEGVIKFHLGERNFINYVADHSGAKKLGSIRGIAKLNGSKILIASEVNMLFELDLATEKMTCLTDVIPALNQYGGFRECRNIITQGDTVAWLSNRMGIWKYVPARKTMQRLEVSIPLPFELFQIEWSYDKSKILVYCSLGLMSVDPNTGQASLFQDKNGNNPLVSTQPSCMWHSKPDVVWLGSLQFGLIKVDLTSKMVEIFNEQDGFTSNNIAAIQEDKKGMLWIGTMQGGLHHFDPVTGKLLDIFTRDQGLPNNNVVGILTNDQGQLWLSTYSGLCFFDPILQSFRNYNEADGLNHNEFNRTSYFYDAQTRRYFFGGLKGLNSFFEDDMRVKSNTSALLVSELFYYTSEDKPRTVYAGIVSGTTITLPAANRAFSLKLALANYENPASNQFSYKIEGLDKNWILLGTNRELRFNHLPAGNYTLYIRGADNRGNWSDQQIVLYLHVQEFWYKRWWAWLMYLLLIGGGAYLFYRSRLKQQLTEKETLRLQELDEFKSRFFTNITHEFRTPLTVMAGQAEILESDMQKAEQEGTAPKPAIIRQKVASIRRNGENLGRLINEMLDLAKLENNSLSLNYIHGDVAPYLRYVVESLQPLANVQNVLLRTEMETNAVEMDYDPDRLLQIVHNLLSNAVKFTPSGGQVTMRLSTEPAHDGEGSVLMIRVTDTGIGIPEEALPYIFDRFYQARNQQTQKPGGSGIGLSLTRELVKFMHGSIEAQSKAGEGSTFIVRLPITHRAPASAELVEPTPVYTGAVPRELGKGADHSSGLPVVLIVEDNPDVVEYVSSCFSGLYQLEFAFNGRSGLEKALEIIPDLIVSDVMMPEMDGFTLCETLKQDERSSHIPIILLTAKAGLESRIAGLKRGADVYLAKPFNREELLVQAGNLLEVRRKLQAHYASTVLEDPLSAGGQKAEAVNPENNFLLKLRTLLEKHLDDSSLSPDFVCKKMGMSRTNLHRKLVALTNLPLTMFIRNLRMQRAKQLLSNQEMNISEVAFAVGFDDPKYFSRVFSETFGMTPSDFQNQAKK